MFEMLNDRFNARLETLQNESTSSFHHHHHLLIIKQVQAVTWTQVSVTGQQGT